MAVLCISRQFGAGGRTLGEMVASELGYRFLYESQLDQMASQAGGIKPQISQADPGFMDRWTGSRKEDTAHLESLRRVIQKLGKEGNAVLLGRGAQFILRQQPDAVRVLLVAEPAHRVGFMVMNYDMDEGTAKRLIAEADKKRARFLRNFYPGEPDEASLYHLALNTSLITLQGATNLVTRLVRRMDEKLKPPARA